MEAGGPGEPGWDDLAEPGRPQALVVVPTRELAVQVASDLDRASAKLREICHLNVSDDTIERVNITLPRRVLKRLDAKASAVGESRSSYIARMAVD